MGAVNDTDVGGMSDEELEAEQAELATLRTAVRLRQNEVAGELEVRKAMAGMSAAGRGRLVKIQLEGGIAPEGTAANTVEEG